MRLFARIEIKRGDFASKSSDVLGCALHMIRFSCSIVAGIADVLMLITRERTREGRKLSIFVSSIRDLGSDFPENDLPSNRVEGINRERWWLLTLVWLGHEPPRVCENPYSMTWDVFPVSIVKTILRLHHSLDSRPEFISGSHDTPFLKKYLRESCSRPTAEKSRIRSGGAI